MIDRRGAAVLLAAMLAGCGGRDAEEGIALDTGTTVEMAAGEVPVTCPGSDGGLQLPEGFCATIFADSVGGARHIIVAPNGDVFVQLMGTRRGSRNASGGNGILALRDTDHDGRADTSASFGKPGGTGIGLHGGFLYADDQARIVRYPLMPGALTPSGAAQDVVVDLPTGGHGARNFTFDSAGALYVNVGSRTNSCQVDDREKESPGHDPCTALATRAGIWKFDANKLGQRQSDGQRFATGIRNAMGLAISPIDGKLYATQHGRDQLFQNWPQHFDARQSAENPAEELVQVNAGDDFGWPYCFYSRDQKRLVLAPEYGGDGKKVERCANKKEPIAVFPGHWAPVSAIFYTGTQFPPRYRGGMFIAFHGSWNRAPEPQAGFRVSFVPARDGAPSTEYETFADGFTGGDGSRGGAAHRPLGLAQGPDGALYITDDRAGRIWEVRYTGEGSR
ncbi:MAG TPA: PQQ-dependent sugar dehydrogenase [Gemmatimonadaceae bacterium]